MEGKEIRSQKLLKLEMRKPYQTVAFVYKALDIAEEQIKEQNEELLKLKKENRRLNLLSKNKKRR